MKLQTTLRFGLIDLGQQANMWFTYTHPNHSKFICPPNIRQNV